jgi:hypothetical protein
MSVNLAEAIQTKHVVTFGLVALVTKGLCELLPGNGEASDHGIFGGGLTLGGKGIDNLHASL